MTKPSTNILDRPILTLSDIDHLTLRDMVSGGILVLGDPGSGKSTTSSKAIICGLMRAGVGGLLLTVKSSDAANYVAYARECGREADILLFSEVSGLCFDPLAYEWARGAGDVEAIVDYFSTLLSIGKQEGGGGDHRFFQLASEQAMRNAIHLIKLAGEPLSIVHIHRAIASFPTYVGEHDTEEWQQRSYIAQLIKQIRARKETLTECEWQDLETATEFVFVRWASLDERPRSSISMTFAGMADKFLFHPLRRIFASGTYDFSPEQATHERKLIIVDFPVLEYGKETARLIQIMVKLTFQRAWLRHKFSPGCCHGACLVQDEFQLLISRFENHFAQTCRDSAIASLSITQNILNLAEELGETQPGSKTRAFLNNLGLKIVHRSTCPDTCSYIADVIGKEYRYIENFSAGGGGEAGHAHTSVGGSRQLVHLLEPIELSRLTRPDGDSPLAAAVIYKGGSTFNATRTRREPEGKNFLKVHFSR
jgi:hypothetical protein